MIKIKWKKVLKYNDLDQKPIINWIDLANGSMFRIFAFFSHGGNFYPRPGFVVGLERIGSFFFYIEKPFHYSYVSQKLNLPSSDARAMSDWMNAQLDLDNLVEQQGEYMPAYFTNHKTYNYGSENPTLILCPDIVD